MAADGIERPTVVQAESFGVISRGRDAVLCAETGSGKTLAYLLPLVSRLYHLHDRAREQAESGESEENPLSSLRPWVILAPTQDLCAQILAMLERLDTDRLVAAQSLQRLFRWEAMPSRELRSASGSSFQAPAAKEKTTLPRPSHQRGRAKPGAAYVSASPSIRWGSTDIVVTTPMKFCEDLARLKEDQLYPSCVVMDEADSLFHGPGRTHLFDIFEALRPRLKIRHAGETRSRLPDMVPTQFIFAAATMIHIGPFSVGNMLIERFCTAQIIQTKQFHRLPTGISLDSVRWEKGSDDWDKRVAQLLEILRSYPCERTLVFANSLHNCFVLLQFLKENGWPVGSFMKGPMGRMGPRFRDAQKFMEGEVSVLIATEFGGRGIDWANVDHVINFQMPSDVVCWLHRAGRTGRMGTKGLVTNFVGSKDVHMAHLIETRLQDGKDLHGAFSRRRSLPKRLKSHRRTDGDGEAELASAAAFAEDGTVKFEGGLDVFLEGQSEADDEGALIGYIQAPEQDAGAAGQSLRQQARRKGQARAQGAQGLGSAEEDSLDRFRRQLLDSDSDSDGEDDAGSDDGDGEAGGTGDVDQAFRWSRLDDGDASAPRGPVPRQPLMDRGGRRRERDSGTRRFRRFERVEHHEGSRKGLGVQAQGKAKAGRNYAEPDDDLLL